MTDSFESVRQRVQNEKRQLDSRVERLQRFIKDDRHPLLNAFARLPLSEQSRLRIQLAIMEAYGTVLGERLAHMPSDDAPGDGK